VRRDRGTDSAMRRLASWLFHACSADRQRAGHRDAGDFRLLARPSSTRSGICRAHRYMKGLYAGGFRQAIVSYDVGPRAGPLEMSCAAVEARVDDHVVLRGAAQDRSLWASCRCGVRLRGYFVVRTIVRGATCRLRLAM